MKFLVAILFALFSFATWACPYCAGNTQGGKDNNTTLILSVFILAIYIPYYIIWRLIKKSREMHASQEPKA
jgi:hypothetical protein